MNPSDLVEELKSQLCQLLDQSRTKIVHCLHQLEESEIWWRPVSDISSIGNLILHITGNLKQWSTTMLREEADSRDRESEFSNQNWQSKSELLTHLESEVSAAKKSIVEFKAAALLNRVEVQGFQVSVMEALIHTTTHFQGHTHQIILLTRLQLKDRYVFQWNPEIGRDSLPM